MASIKIVLRKNKQKNDGTVPLALRISKDYKTSYVFLKQYILEKDWDEKAGKVKRTHPNSARLNNFLMQKLVEANNIGFDTGFELSTSDLKKRATNDIGKLAFFELGFERVKRKFERGTFSVAKSEGSILYNIQEFLTHKPGSNKQTVIDGIKARRGERIRKSRQPGYSYLDDLKNDFAGNKSLSFEEINLGFIRKYKQFCAVYLGQKPRTITNQLIFIRTLFNVAIKERGLNIKHYPFAGDNEIIRLKSQGNKIGLEKEEIKRIELMQFEQGSTIWHTRNIWLFAYYFAGVRISDVLKLKWSDFMDGRLYYDMSKNDKPVSLKIPDQAMQILEYYEAEKERVSDYVFPFLKKANPKDRQDVFRKSRNASRLFNKYLKRIAKECGIEKNLTNHIARHSFGNLAGDTIHPLMLQKLYRHSDLKTTINYQANFIHKEADEALEKVLGGSMS